MKKIILFYNSKLSLWVIICAVIAYLHPGIFIIFKEYINLFFAITMFGIGLVITDDDYRNIINSPREILFGNLCQFTIMPLLGLVTAWIFSLPKEITVGLVLTGAAPGAMTSNVISYLSDGDVAYSVSLTAVATLLSPLLTPMITLLLAGTMIHIPFFSMFLTIIYTVVLPLLLGFVVRKFFTETIEKFDFFPPALSVTAIVVITSYVVAANRDNLGKATMIIFAAVVFHNIMGMLLGYASGSAAKYSFKRKKTLSIEIGMQNAGLGVILALKHFSQDVAIPAAIFTIWCIISASFLVNFWTFFDPEKNR
ncbi:MAG TPA: bile acid:sodium symporter family protein [Spirochaetota bacterium]|nr:bile acid:sodium symporter family protein [Spirochaetota bacterium]HPI88640.1 bile acid:sodium symporter family protein [Spirochaetota bacterium]HPR49594.1 bile acid:sodium symporter family protein [Spirochaetota bacterium]